MFLVPTFNHLASHALWLSFMSLIITTSIFKKNFLCTDVKDGGNLNPFLPTLKNFHVDNFNNQIEI